MLNHQVEFINSDKQYPALTGGLGSGKSDGAISRILKQKYKYKNLNQLYLLPTYDLVNLMALPRFEEELTKIGQPYKLNKSEYKITLEDKGDIIFRSMERPERIVAFEVADAIIDELDTLKKVKAEYIYRKVSERTRSLKPDGAKNTIGVVTTLDGGVNGFMYDLYNEPKSEQYHRVKASTYDNPYLPDGYIEQIEANYDPIMAKMYLMGEFVSLNTNRIFHYFNRKTHNTDREIRSTDTLHIGLDFNIEACAAVVWIIENGIPKAIDEFLSFDTYDVINNTNKRYNTQNITFYPDASGGARSTNASQSDIQILVEAGFNINTPSKNGAIRDRINSVNALLSKDKLEVNTRKCPRFTNALENHAYNDKGEPEKFSEHKAGAIDDWTDGGTYTIVRLFPIHNQRTQTVSRRSVI